MKTVGGTDAPCQVVNRSKDRHAFCATIRFKISTKASRTVDIDIPLIACFSCIWNLLNTAASVVHGNVGSASMVRMIQANDNWMPTRAANSSLFFWTSFLNLPLWYFREAKSCFRHSCRFSFFRTLPRRPFVLKSWTVSRYEIRDLAFSFCSAGVSPSCNNFFKDVCKSFASAKSEAMPLRFHKNVSNKTPISAIACHFFLNLNVFKKVIQKKSLVPVEMVPCTSPHLGPSIWKRTSTYTNCCRTASNPSDTTGNKNKISSTYHLFLSEKVNCGESTAQNPTHKYMRKRWLCETISKDTLWYPASCFTLYYTKTDVIEPVTGVTGFLNNPRLIDFSMVPNLSRTNTQDQKRLPWFSS